jgi:hypothetical protein
LEKRIDEKKPEKKKYSLFKGKWNTNVTKDTITKATREKPTKGI